jgi:hypothetical protein
LLKNPALAYYNRAQLYQEINRLADAEKDLHKALECDLNMRTIVRSALLDIKRRRVAASGHPLDEATRKKLIKEEMHEFSKRL